jgi:hypothetical protein
MLSNCVPYDAMVRLGAWFPILCLIDQLVRTTREMPINMCNVPEKGILSEWLEDKSNHDNSISVMFSRQGQKISRPEGEGWSLDGPVAVTTLKQSVRLIVVSL